jgi:hypothetical protein
MHSFCGVPLITLDMCALPFRFWINLFALWRLAAVNGIIYSLHFSLHFCTDDDVVDFLQPFEYCSSILPFRESTWAPLSSPFSSC